MFCVCVFSKVGHTHSTGGTFSLLYKNLYSHNFTLSSPLQLRWWLVQKMQMRKRIHSKCSSTHIQLFILIMVAKASWNEIIKMDRQKSTTITNGLRNHVTCFILMCPFQCSKLIQVNNQLQIVAIQCAFFRSCSVLKLNARGREKDWISHESASEWNALIR